MYRHQSQTLQHFSRLVRQLMVVLPRSYATKRSKMPILKKASNSDELVCPGKLKAPFFVEYIGSKDHKWRSILREHPELKNLNAIDVINTMNALKRLNFTVEDIMTKPMILYTNVLTLENRYKVLQECGFELVTITLLSKYVTAMNLTVEKLKFLQYIPFSVNVVERLRACFTDIDIELNSQYPCNEDLDLKFLRQNILNSYLRQKLDMSPEDLEKLFSVYNRIRHKSFLTTQKMVKVLLEDLQFPKERIIKNGFMLHGDPDNVRRIINEIPTIDGHDIKEILYKRPKIMMSSCDSLLKTMKHVKKFGIDEAAIFRCLEILTLGPDTVLERLTDLNNTEQFQVLSTNPRVLRLVHYQNKARLRLDYLSKMRVRCASLHILSCGSEAFIKFARDGSDRTKGRDSVVYIANELNKSESDVRNLFSRHPNWCHIPVLQAKQCYEYLLKEQFSKEDIYNNIHLLLYPIERIGEKLVQVCSADFFDELNLCESNGPLTKNKMLNLILYLIECEFHFTGDGVWTQYHPMENFNNLLPDFPESRNKIYKYGMKSSPPTTSIESMKDCVTN